MLSSTARIRVPHRNSNARCGVFNVCAIAVTLLSGSFVTSAFGAPAKLDALIAPSANTPFPLESQPRLFSDAFAAALNSDNMNNNNSNNGEYNGDSGLLDSQPTAIDSYGNPIESLKPIETPDGRKVISAQGLQFEIPNYASGITEIKKPADDLLPPFIDPIAVAVPNDSIDGTGSNAAATVDVENAQIVVKLGANSRNQSPDEPQSSSGNSLPAYIAELNDPDIGGPVEYMPADEGSSLKVIAWDLLPPVVQDAQTTNADNSIPKEGTGGNDDKRFASKVPTSSFATTTKSTSTIPPTPTKATTARATTTTHRPTTRATTTTRRPAATTTRRTTTTTARTTSTRSTPSTTTTPAPPLNPDDFYRLEHGDSYTLPSWLADIDDPELDSAVTYSVPENIHEYANDTIARDLLPPLEPYTDLNNIDLPVPTDVQSVATSTLSPSAPSSTKTATTTNRPRTTVAPTSKRPVSTTIRTTYHPTTTSTPRPHPTIAPSKTTKKTAASSFDGRFTSNNIAQSHEAAKTTTPKPQHPIISFKQKVPTPNADPITGDSSDVASGPQVGGEFKISNSNPFLSKFNGAAGALASPTTVSTITTTTTTTTPATPVEENPFDSATLPPWLADFDYADLAPGVPFTYTDEQSKSDDVFNDLLPPSYLNMLATDTTKPVPVSITSSSPDTSFNSFQHSPNSADRHTPTSLASATSTFAFNNNNFPSKVTTTTNTKKPSSNIHNPFAQVPNNSNNNDDDVRNNNNNQVDAALFTSPTAVGNDFSNTNAAPTDNLNLNTFDQSQSPPQLQSAASADETIIQNPSSPNFNQNFAAPFDTSITTASGFDADASFPAVSIADGSSPKTTFTKSTEGKVITNNNGFGAPTTTKQFGFGASTTAGQQQTTFEKGFQQSSVNQFASTSSSFSGTTSTSNKVSTPSGFTAFPTSSTSQQNADFGGAGKYTGGFGGAPGVLGGTGKLGFAVQADGSNSVHVATASSGAAPSPTAPFNKFATSPSFANRVAVAPQAVGNVNSKYQGTFGGPPGVLAPFDNDKSG